MYPSLGTKSLEMLNCETVAGEDYLSSDFRVRCWEGDHAEASVIAWLAIAIYVIGIPTLLAYALYASVDRAAALNTMRSLRLRARREVKEVQIMFGSLYESYSSEYYYYEIVEMVRKLMLTGVLVFVQSGSSGQLLFGILICAAHVLFLANCAPYVSAFDNQIAQMTSCQLLLTMLIGIVYKLDSSIEGATEREFLAGILTFMYWTVLILGFILLWIQSEKLANLANDAAHAASFTARNNTEIVPAVGTDELGVDGGGDGGGWTLTQTDNNDAGGEGRGVVGDDAVGGAAGGSEEEEEIRASAPVVEEGEQRGQVGHEETQRQQDAHGQQEANQQQKEYQEQEQQQQQQQVRQQQQEQQQQQQRERQQGQPQQRMPPHLHAEVDRAIARLRQEMGTAIGRTAKQVRLLNSLEEQKRVVNRRWAASVGVERIGKQLATLKNQIRSEARRPTPVEQQQGSQLQQALQRARL